MRTIQFRNSTVIGDRQAPYFVAEMNTSHFGSLDVAKEMIDKAKSAGCDCVKFQSWSAESINSKNFYESNPISRRFFTKFSFGEKELFEVANYARSIGIAFSSTPYSPREVDFLLEACDSPYIKIASMELNNHRYLEYIAKTGAPIILSTGMGDMDEIRSAVKVIEGAGNNNLCILHCISIYPQEIHTIHLNNLLGLREEFPQYPIGFSDHSIGIEMAVASIALGACLVEKHFTLDKTKIGMDNQVALEANEMSLLVKSCKNVFTALGNKNRHVMAAEIEQRSKMRRSLIYTRDLKSGELIRECDMDSKRPGTGIPPNNFGIFVGKCLRKDVLADSLLELTDFAD